MNNATEIETELQSADIELDSVYGIGENVVKSITETIQNEEETNLREFLTGFSSSSIADLLEQLDEETRVKLFELAPESISADAISEIVPDLRSQILSSMPPQQVAKIISELDSDDALDLIINLDPDFQKNVIRKLSPKNRIVLEEGLNFPEDSAGRLMQREFVAIPQFWTVGKTIDYLRADTDLPEEFFDLFVITPTHHVIGEIPLNRLVRAKRSEKLENLSLDKTHPIPAGMDQEEVGILFQREGIVSAPVVDDEGRLIGVITFDDVIDVISEEAQEDFLRLGGIEKDDLYKAVWSTGKSRFRWLFVNLLTAILASIVISLFDATLEQAVSLAILMPIVASMGGNAGTQSLTVAVRGLATRQITKSNMFRLLWKEALVGALNGIAFAFIIAAIAGLWFQSVMLGIVIALAMILNLFVAGLCGAAIPILLDRIGSDPAESSAVFLTTITDVVGFFAFLGLAAILFI